MSFDTFLHTTKDRNVSLPFAYNALANPDSVSILFVMTIEPSKSTTSFASINGISYLQQEDVVLFSMQTIFRIHDIKSMDENHRLFQVDLILADENDKDLHEITDRIREKTFPDHKGWERLCLLLLKMGQSAKAQQVYQVLLDHATSESEKAYIYHRLGWIKYDQREYNEAITFYEKVLEIYKKNAFSHSLISLMSTTILVWCMKTWVNTRKHFRLIKRP